ncbi:MAG: hypothetical protein HC880_21710 [Bacteroidia bacterium]|nr:hypothetical protein [Bacteroidia bacterium]
MNLDVSLIKSVLTIYDELLDNGISLVYLGEFSHEITKMFTSMAEDDMDRKSEKISTKKKVYHVMVETLQNMNKHSDDLTDEGNIGRGMFMIAKKNKSYYVITSNRVSRAKKESLEEMLEKINASSMDELREMYLSQIKQGKISEKGGAGLGLIDIARKTTGRHDYQFIPYDADSFFFILKVEINTKDIKDKAISDIS